MDMRGRPGWRVLGLWLLLAAGGCSLGEVHVEVASERTSLENQVLGSYHALSRELALAASVRGVDPLGRIQTPPPRSPERQDALEAMETLRFHADDVEAFKRLGWVGENNRGLLTRFAIEREKAPEDLREFAARYPEAEFRSVVAEVNRAREVIMERVIQVSEGLGPQDLPKVREIFAKMYREGAGSGERIQGPDGTWRRKP